VVEDHLDVNFSESQQRSSAQLPYKRMSISTTKSEPITIEWPCEKVVPSKRCESRVIQTLHRKGEWGRGRDLPKDRLIEIQTACDENNMTLYQALSLRRTMLRTFPGGMKLVNQSQAMGTNAGQQEIATIFEQAVEKFLLTLPRVVMGEDFLTESILLSEMKKGTRARGPTPDILFVHPVSINGRLVKWIDAKMYYASASFAKHKIVPNGKLKSIAQRYNDFYGGQGAFVFGQGYCACLQDIVSNALLLDTTPLDMSAVTAYQEKA